MAYFHFYLAEVIAITKDDRRVILGDDGSITHTKVPYSIGQRGHITFHQEIGRYGRVVFHSDKERQRLCEMCNAQPTN